MTNQQSFDVHEITKWTFTTSYSDAKAEVILTVGSCGVDVETVASVEFKLGNSCFYIGQQPVPRYLADGLETTQTITIAARERIESCDAEVAMLAKAFRYLGEQLSKVASKAPLIDEVHANRRFDR